MKPALSTRLPWQRSPLASGGLASRVSVSRFDLGLIFFLAIIVPAGLNYWLGNIVVGGGGIKFTLAELGVLIALFFLLPKTFVVLKQVPAFWVCLVALIVPPLIHLYPGIKTYGMSALRDILSVVDLIYFLAGLSV